MSSILYNDTVKQACNVSMEENILSVPKHYISAKHGIRHTIVIHLIDYMENKGLTHSSDFLAATYIAGDECTMEPLYELQIQEYIQMILILREHDQQGTLEMFDIITDDEIIYCLIHLWVDLLFLDYNSNNKETKKYIIDYVTYIDMVLKYLTREPNQIEKYEAFNTIADVLFTEINIVRTNLIGEGGPYDRL